MKTYAFLLCLVVLTQATGQTKSFLDIPYLETAATSDTLVVPDRIFLGIHLQEADSKDRVTLEVLEQRLVGALGSCQVDTQKQLSVSGLSSDFRTYFLKGQKVLKQKYFELLVYDAQTAGCVLYELEQAGISNVRFLRAEYAGMDALQTTLKARAVAAAHQRASAMAGAVGQVVGKAVYISDTGSYGPVYSPAPMPRMAMAEADAASSYKAIDAEFRKLKVEVQVQVKFLLE